MATRGRKSDDAAAKLREETQDPTSATAQRALAGALAKKTAYIVSLAANVVREHALDGFEPALIKAWSYFLVDGVKRDPGCLAKEAIIEALDHAESLEEDLFEQGITCTQMEPSWGPPVDSATGIRSRCAFALVRLHHGDILWHIANLLVDPAASVRAAAAQALAYKQDPAGAPMLLLRLRMGDDDPVAVTAHLAALLGLAPRQGLRLVRETLSGSDEDARHAAAFALGESRHAEAFAVLREWLDRAVTVEDRRAGFTALAMLRDDAARAYLLEIIATGSGTDSCQVLRALGPYRFDADLCAAAHAAANRHPDRQPPELAAELFGEAKKGDP